MKTTSSPAKQQFGVEIVPLDNGSTLYFKRMEGAPRVALGIYVHGGNRVEPMPGVADMVDDLLCEGTHKRSAEQIALEMDSLSLDMDTDTRRDYSIMSATFLEEDMDDSVELLADMLYNASLAEFEKEKVRLHGELIMEMDSPRNRSHDLMMTTLFAGTPYRASNSNILEALPGITSVEPLKTHYNLLYQPENTIFSAVGDIPAEAMQQCLNRHFNRTPGKNYSENTAPFEAGLTESRYVTAVRDDSKQLHIFKGWFAPPMSHPDYAALVVMNTILGGAGLTSRLFVELRDKQGLAYNVRSQYETSRYVGLFAMYIGTEPNNREKALKGFEVECQKLMDNPVSHQELEEAKENILGRRVVFLETAAQQCTYIGNHMALGMTLEDIDRVPQKIQAVTALEVQEVARKYLSRPSITAAVGPQAFL